MGNFIHTEEITATSNKELVFYFRNKVKLHQVLDIFRDYVTHYYPKIRLCYEEFDDVFSPLLNNTEPVFKVLQERGDVDIYEAFISMVLFSQGDYQTKLQAVFTAFDIDCGGSIDRKELSQFMMSSCVGLCKLVGLPQPSRFGIQEYTYEVFKKIDADCSGQIEFDEFATWIKESDEIQDFLLMHIGLQTHERAVLRFNREFKKWIELFHSVSVCFMGTEYAEINVLKKKMDEEMPYIESDIRDKLYFLMNYEGNDYIKQEDFQEIIKPWASFSATDINNDNELDIIELKTLFWLMDGKEPEQARVQKELKMIDEDKSGTIDRMEWIQYLVSPDPTTGASYFDFELRAQFDSFDHDKDGVLDAEEMTKFLKEDLAFILVHIPESEKERIEKVFESLTRDICAILNNKKTKEKESVPWSNFKKYKVVCKDRINETIEFIKEFCFSSHDEFMEKTKTSQVKIK